MEEGDNPMIDYAALLGAAAGIRVAKASYVAGRDPTNPGSYANESDVLPAAALILGYACLTLVAFTFATTGAVYFQMQQGDAGEVDPTLNNVKILWYTAVYGNISTVQAPITVLITGSQVLTGEAKLFVFYVPT